MQQLRRIVLALPESLAHDSYFVWLQVQRCVAHISTTQCECHVSAGAVLNKNLLIENALQKTSKERCLRNGLENIQLMMSLLKACTLWGRSVCAS